MTTPFTFISHVGLDGIVRFEAATDLVDTDVLVTVKPVGLTAKHGHGNGRDWHDFVNRTYGSLAHVDDFDAPDDPPAVPLDFSL